MLRCAGLRLLHLPTPWMLPAATWPLCLPAVRPVSDSPMRRATGGEGASGRPARPRPQAQQLRPPLTASSPPREPPTAERGRAPRGIVRPHPNNVVQMFGHSCPGDLRHQVSHEIRCLLHQPRGHVFNKAVSQGAEAGGARQNKESGPNWARCSATTAPVGRSAML